MEEKEQEKKGFMKRIADKIDSKMKEKSKKGSCCCDSSCSEK